MSTQRHAISAAESQESTEVQNASSDSEKFDECVGTLAELPEFDYQRVRKEYAKMHGIGVSYLDGEVQKRRQKNQAPNKNDILMDNIEPWPEPVDGHELLTETEEILLKHTILPRGASVVMALWILGTYCFDCFRKWPKLLITSPEKRCGKTTLMEVLSAICLRPFATSNITPAAIYRIIEAFKPTLIIDEADTFFNNNKEIRGIINSSYTKSHAYVFRSSSGKGEAPQRFSTWVSMVIGMIGMPPDTILDRSIVIQLRRKLADEITERIPLNFSLDCFHLCQKMLRWAEDHKDQLEEYIPDLPHSHNDRELDNWIPLFTIAGVVGDQWYTRTLQAYSSMIKIEDESIGVRLLADIKDVFDQKGVQKIFSNDLVHALITAEESLWSEFKGNKALTATALARLLKPFGIKSKQIRLGDINRNGYNVDMFKDAFMRYVPESTLQSSTALQSAPTKVTD